MLPIGFSEKKKNPNVKFAILIHYFLAIIIPCVVVVVDVETAIVSLAVA